MAIFKKKLKAATPPEEQESPEELEEDDNNYDDEEEEEVKPVKKKVSLPKLPEQKEVPQYKEIPVCLSQSQINNIIIENNIMLKQIISEMDWNV